MPFPLKSRDRSHSGPVCLRDSAAARQNRPLPLRRRPCTSGNATLPHMVIPKNSLYDFTTSTEYCKRFLELFVSLFANPPRGAKANAILFSIIEIAKENVSLFRLATIIESKDKESKIKACGAQAMSLKNGSLTRKVIMPAKTNLR